LEANSISFPLGRVDESFFKIMSAFELSIYDVSVTLRTPIVKQTLKASNRFSNSSFVITSESYAGLIDS